MCFGCFPATGKKSKSDEMMIFKDEHLTKILVTGA